MQFEKILLIGCGNMAGAMLDGWLAAGLPAERFTVVDPHAKERRANIRWLDALPEQERFDAVLLGIKPQGFAELAPKVAPLAGNGTVVLSILAGVELAVLAEQFPDAGLVRIMPNLAAALGKSPIALASQGLDGAAQASVKKLLDLLGTAEWFEEDAFDAVTALAGSGPAFVYRFIDALAQAGAEIGLPQDKAATLALAMVEGASALASASPHDPGELARRVASPGGVTQAGLDALDEGDALNRLIQHTLRAARDRSAEMAAESRARRQS